MHQLTKLVKVGSLSLQDRKDRGLEGQPDDMVIPIVVADFVPDEKPAGPRPPVKVPDGHRLQDLPDPAPAPVLPAETESEHQVETSE